MEYTNSKFETVSKDLKKHFLEDMCDEEYLFKLNIPYKDLFETYLNSFPNEIKGIYREKAWHDCSACRKFFKKMGNVISISKHNDEFTIKTLFDFNTIEEYQMVMDKLNEYVLNHFEIENVFLSSQREIGVEENFEELDDGTIIKHNHFYTTVPVKFLCRGDLINKELGEYKTNKNVLNSTLENIHIEAVITVLKLIDDGNLYRGSQWKNSLEQLKNIMNEYITNDYYGTTSNDKEIFLWYNSVKYGGLISKIKNTSIGVLLDDITDGMDLEEALRRYESIVAPQNYQRPKPIFTEQMVADAEKKISDLGYMGSLNRRFARIDDLDINDVLYINRNESNTHNESVFDKLKKEAIVKPKYFDNLEEISLNKFIEEILPNSDSVKIYLSNDLDNNLVSLITSEDTNSKSMFKWSNNFSWAYKNNIADSLIKEQVKKMGGDVDVDLRFSIEWNSVKGEYDGNDLDAHCLVPNGNVIMYNNKRDNQTGGWLDVDIINPLRNVSAVENIRFKQKKKMLDGDYLFNVHNFNYCGGDGGFKAEVEFDDRIYSFNYPYKLGHKETVQVARVTLKDGVFTLKNLLDNVEMGDGLNVWGVKFNTFVPVECICFSPNYWEENGVGLKHLFFFIKDCVNPSNPNAWFNEFLNSELKEHRKVMEALGSKCKIESSDEQLSGVGFSVDRGLSVIVQIHKPNQPTDWSETYKILIQEEL
jgi:hypothetical protein